MFAVAALVIAEPLELNQTSYPTIKRALGGTNHAKDGLNTQILAF